MGMCERNIINRVRTSITTAAEKAGTTRAELSRPSGVSESQISRLMVGKTLSVQTLVRHITRRGVDVRTEG